jgi:hypothetical protein
VPDAIATIPEGDWQPLDDYPDDGEAQIAQTMVGQQRLVVRRTRLVGPQAELWPDWRHFAFLTNRTEALEVVEAEHRQHAVVELAIRDLKDQALAHVPSGNFNANAAWTVIACLTHNLAALDTLEIVDGERPTRRAISRTPRPCARRIAISSRSANDRYRPDAEASVTDGISPPSRNHRTPTGPDTPAAAAASSLDSPRAIARQNACR